MFQSFSFWQNNFREIHIWYIVVKLGCHFESISQTYRPVKSLHFLNFKSIFAYSREEKSL